MDVAHRSLDMGASVGEWVRQHPRLSVLFKTLGIDYCCGGKKPLATVAHDINLSLESLNAQMVDYLSPPSGRSNQEDSQWDVNHLESLCNHIYQTHHEYLYKILPVLSKQLGKLTHVHGKKHPELLTLQQVFEDLHRELLTHMEKEERVLFPYCCELDKAMVLPVFHCGSLENPLMVMEREHQEAGNALAQINALTKGYRPPADACNTYHNTYTLLKELEQDLHQHIHKENNILFLLAREKVKTLQQDTTLAAVSNRKQVS